MRESTSQRASNVSRPEGTAYRQKTRRKQRMTPISTQSSLQCENSRTLAKMPLRLRQNGPVGT
jgi:hypothetical protein